MRFEVLVGILQRVVESVDHMIVGRVNRDGAKVIGPVSFSHEAVLRSRQIEGVEVPAKDVGERVEDGAEVDHARPRHRCRSRWRV